MVNINKMLTKRRIKLFKPYLKGDVLDIGCGYGDLYKIGRVNISNYYGIDKDPNLIRSLRFKHPECRFFVKDVDDDPLDLDRKFDIIVLSAMIEHVFNQKFCLMECRKYLKPNGKIVITTPTIFGNDFVYQIIISLVKMGAIPRGIMDISGGDDHIVIYNEDRFKILAKKLGMKIIEYRTFNFKCNQWCVLKNKKK